VKLIDFGLAVPNTEVFHRPGNRTGTLQYMAPELLRREATDERLDIFSFGVTMFEFLSGKLPYDATNSMAMMLQRINHPPLDIAQAAPQLPSDLCEVVRKAMARNLQDRWPAMATMAATLRDLPSVAVAKPTVVIEERPSSLRDVQDDADFFETLGVVAAPAENPTESEPGVSEAIGVAADAAVGSPVTEQRTQEGQPQPTIPLVVRREVWKRDQGRCVACGGNQDLKYKHIVPLAQGGSATAENVRILCKPCRQAIRANA
jgi:serine/threonine protein kinase